ncbi:MAG: hypothetical protein RLZ12_60 [Bacillota bacterium]|jgi:GTP-binding protein
MTLVAIVGRANVGKSTFFNRIIGKRVAIIDDKPGVTRDRVYGQCTWNECTFSVVDTGGLTFITEDELSNKVYFQMRQAIAEAAVILFFVDVLEGLLDVDKELAGILRRLGKKVIVVVNKVDNAMREQDSYQFYNLGFKEVFFISSIHGRGTGDLLDAVTNELNCTGEEPVNDEIIKVACIGRPNVGKSSLINALLGSKRVIVDQLAGTTRDAIDTNFSYDDQEYCFIDTAGIRKSGKVQESVERYSVMRAKEAIERADVCLIVLDGEAGIIEQDKKIAGLAEKAGCACLFIVNKWDKVFRETQTRHKFKEHVLAEFKFMKYALVHFVSAMTGENVLQIFPLIDQVAGHRATWLKTPVLNQVLQEALARRPAPVHKGLQAKIQYVVQAAIKPPTFFLFVNDPRLVHFSYLRYLENYFRNTFNFAGTPIKFVLKKK